LAEGTRRQQEESNGLALPKKKSPNYDLLTKGVKNAGFWAVISNFIVPI